MRKLSAKIAARLAVLILALAGIGLLLNWASLLIGGLLFALS